ncbi:MAG TPA: hypothetical protein VE964_11265, partial [Myxococcales bacterium]|nr:hypothetical protein [Myxococcales bacterium]
MSRLAALAVLLAPAAALAQTQSITVKTQGTLTNTVTLGLDECNNNRQIVFQWDLNTTPAASDMVKIFISKDTASCSAASEPTTAPSPPLIQPTSANASDQATVSTRQLLLDLQNGCANTEHKATNPFTVFFCVRRSTSGGAFISFGLLQVNIALVPPNAPSAPAVTPGDSHLQLDWTSNDSGDASYDVYAFPAGQAVDLSKPARNVVVPNIDLQNDSNGNKLVNGRDYEVFVRSTDTFNNHSGPSASVTGTPIPIDDFYTHYRKLGGSAEGGCATGGGAGLLAAAALALALWRKKRAALLLLTLLAAAPAARAADWTGIDRRPRRWLAAFKIDRYDPQIDSEAGLNGATPYHDVFHGRAPPRFQLEVDYQAFHPFGAVLFGGTIGFWQNHGHGIDPATGKPSSDLAQLRIVPIG